jgi:hypothetical protein
MPQDTKKVDDGGVSDKLAAAKKALESAKNSNVSGRAPMKTMEPPAGGSKKPAASAGMLKQATGDQGGDEAKGIAEKQKNIDQYNDATKDAPGLPKYHDGGMVKEDGPANLEKGEVVIPKDKVKAGEKAVSELKSKAKHAGMISDEADEPKSEEKGESKKEEKSEGKHETSDKHNPAHEGKKKKHVGSHVHSHAAGHTVHHFFDDGSNETQQFGLGDHASAGNSVADMLQSQAPQPQGGDPEGGSPEGGAPQGGM